MNRHALAQQILPGLLASGHFTIPADQESPWFVIDSVWNDGTKEFERNIPAISAAYKLADLMIEEALK